ncbi:hypothetical protein H8356DRAFT_1003784 [Neocallimastix lanati (nom. inval.)]|nr:hypothetical protein H8356DRAFT_1003784 [Neocallimastix sp. JGI-2020a]
MVSIDVDRRIHFDIENRSYEENSKNGLSIEDYALINNKIISYEDRIVRNDNCSPSNLNTYNNRVSPDKLSKLNDNKNGNTCEEYKSSFTSFLPKLTSLVPPSFNSPLFGETVPQIPTVHPQTHKTLHYLLKNCGVQKVADVPCTYLAQTCEEANVLAEIIKQFKEIRVLGFDTETTVFRNHMKGAVSLIQIAPTEDICLLFQVYRMCAFPTHGTNTTNNNNNKNAKENFDGMSYHRDTVNPSHHFSGTHDSFYDEDYTKYNNFFSGTSATTPSNYDDEEYGIEKIWDISQFPYHLKDLLSKKSIIKVGVNAIGDADLLKKWYHFEMKGVIDLQLIAHAMKLPVESLSSLSYLYTGQLLEKDGGIKKMKFDKRVMKLDDVIYSARDAVMGLAIFNRMVRPPVTFPDKLPVQKRNNKKKKNRKMKLSDSLYQNNFYRKKKYSNSSSHSTNFSTTNTNTTFTSTTTNTTTTTTTNINSNLNSTSTSNMNMNMNINMNTNTNTKANTNINTNININTNTNTNKNTIPSIITTNHDTDLIRSKISSPNTPNTIGSSTLKNSHCFIDDNTVVSTSVNQKENLHQEKMDYSSFESKKNLFISPSELNINYGSSLGSIESKNNRRSQRKNNPLSAKFSLKIKTNKNKNMEELNYHQFLKQKLKQLVKGRKSTTGKVEGGLDNNNNNRSSNDNNNNNNKNNNNNIGNSGNGHFMLNPMNGLSMYSNTNGSFGVGRNVSPFTEDYVDCLDEIKKALSSGIKISEVISPKKKIVNDLAEHLKKVYPPNSVVNSEKIVSIMKNAFGYNTHFMVEQRKKRYIYEMVRRLIDSGKFIVNFDNDVVVKSLSKKKKNKGMKKTSTTTTATATVTSTLENVKNHHETNNNNKNDNKNNNDYLDIGKTSQLNQTIQINNNENRHNDDANQKQEDNKMKENEIEIENENENGDENENENENENEIEIENENGNGNRDENENGNENKKDFAKFKESSLLEKSVLEKKEISNDKNINEVKVKNVVDEDEEMNLSLNKQEDHEMGKENDGIATTLLETRKSQEVTEDKDEGDKNENDNKPKETVEEDKTNEDEKESSMEEGQLTDNEEDRKAFEIQQQQERLKEQEEAEKERQKRMDYQNKLMDLIEVSLTEDNDNNESSHVPLRLIALTIPDEQNQNQNQHQSYNQGNLLSSALSEFGEFGDISMEMNEDSKAVLLTEGSRSPNFEKSKEKEKGKDIGNGNENGNENENGNGSENENENENENKIENDYDTDNLSYYTDNSANDYENDYFEEDAVPDNYYYDNYYSDFDMTSDNVSLYSYMESPNNSYSSDSDSEDEYLTSPNRSLHINQFTMGGHGSSDLKHVQIRSKNSNSGGNNNDFMETMIKKINKKKNKTYISSSLHKRNDVNDEEFEETYETGKPPLHFAMNMSMMNDPEASDSKLTVTSPTPEVNKASSNNESDFDSSATIVSKILSKKNRKSIKYYEDLYEKDFKLHNLDQQISSTKEDGLDKLNGYRSDSFLMKSTTTEPKSKLKDKGSSLHLSSKNYPPPHPPHHHHHRLPSNSNSNYYTNNVSSPLSLNSFSQVDLMDLNSEEKEKEKKEKMIEKEENKMKGRDHTIINDDDDDDDDKIQGQGSSSEKPIRKNSQEIIIGGGHLNHKQSIANTPTVSTATSTSGTTTTTGTTTKKSRKRKNSMKQSSSQKTVKRVKTRSLSIYDML